MFFAQELPGYSIDSIMRLNACAIICIWWGKSVRRSIMKLIRPSIRPIIGGSFPPKEFFDLIRAEIAGLDRHDKSR